MIKEILTAIFYDYKNGTEKKGFSIRRAFSFIFLFLFIIDFTWLIVFPGSHWILTFHIQGKVDASIIDTIYETLYVIISLLIIGHTAGKMTKSM